MRKIVVGEFLTLDGVMQGPGGPEEDTSGGFRFGGWTVPYFDDVVGGVMNETFAEPFDLLLGRKTYDIFAAHWPRVAEDAAGVGVDEREGDLGQAFNKATKYVATHSPETLEWQHSEDLGKDIVSRLRELKKSNGPMLLVQGSGKLVQTLLENDLVDEFRVLIFPVVLGKGRRLFAEGTGPGALKVTKSKVSPSGVVALTYERDGEVKVGSFALE